VSLTHNDGVSILITTYNRSDLLDEVLTRLTALFAGDTLEILVWDDASTDATQAVCARHADAVRCIRAETNQGCIAGRRHLIAEARGAYLSFLDDDSCFLDADALRVIRAIFAGHPGCGVIAANIASRGRPSGMAPREMAPVTVAEFIGCGHVLRAEAVRQTGSYPPFLEGYGAEESILALKMLDGGWEVLFVPNLRVYHAEDVSERPVLKRRASALVNDVSVVAAAYPALLLLPGLAKKLASHFVFNLRNGSLAAFVRGVTQLNSALPRAVRDRRPVSIRTLRRWYGLRHEWQGRATEASVALDPWAETQALFRRSGRDGVSA